MRGKRGISHHLDWIIGISLFMLYILFMIVTIKPGIQPLHKGTTLLTIVQDNFVNNVTWNITRVPFNTKVKSSCTGLPNVKIPFPFDWARDKTKMINKNNNDISFNIQSSSLIFEYASTADGILREYYILNSQEFSGGSGGLSDGCSSSDALEYIYGVPELLKGLSESKIFVANYEQVKNIWNYPTNNDFNITVDIEGHKYEISNKNGPPKNANVYVKQFTDFILENSGEKTPATISISVW